MTKEEAIAELKTRYFSMSQCLQVEELHKANESIDLAIEALQTEPCEDCISRQAVLECLDWYEHDRCEIDIYIREIVEDIKKLPPVQPEQKTGHWVEKIVRGRTELYCSACGCGIDVIYEYDYCPNCGAKMEGVAKDET